MSSEVSKDGFVPVLLGGGIGAGKTSVGEVFGRRGFTVIIADDVGRSVLAAGSDEVARVALRWPGAVHDGAVDREALAAIVFSDPAELKALEAIVHPGIDAAIRAELASLDEPVVIEIPVLAVLGELEAVRIAITADDEVRVARAVARGNDGADVQARMRSQISQDEWRRWADVVIDNSGPWAQTELIVEAVIDEVLDG